MNRGIFVTARLNSTRLPKKATKKIYDEVSLLEHILRRAKLSALADKVILCTTTEALDYELVEIARKCEISIYQGEVLDKLTRWRNAAAEFEIDTFVTHDGDDPFCDPSLSDEAFNQMDEKNLDFIFSEKIIPGIFTFAIRTCALNKVCEIKDSTETEMMWTYFKDTGIFKIGELENYPKELRQDGVRLTVDYPEDLALVREIFKRIPKKESIDVQAVVNLLLNDENLRNLNWFRNEEFIANQKSRTILKLKS